MDTKSILESVGSRPLSRGDFMILHDYFGNHSKAARLIGMDPAHYRVLRKSLKTSRITSNFICLLSDLIQAGVSPDKGAA